MGDVLHFTKIHEAEGSSKLIAILLTDEQKQALPLLLLFDVTQTLATIGASAVLTLPMEKRLADGVIVVARGGGEVFLRFV
ncbi:hypothetical protein D3C85_996390 [compost metagenome]